jgi:hypothetical protein
LLTDGISTVIKEGIRHERAQKTQDEPRAVQMSLFDIMGKS